jgi:hypothetical protein
LIRLAKKQVKLSLLNAPLEEGSPKNANAGIGQGFFLGGIMNEPVDPVLGFRNVDVLKQHGQPQMGTNSSQHEPIKGIFNRRPTFQVPIFLLFYS